VQAVSPLVVCIAAQRRSEQALSPSAEAQTQTERYCFDWTTTSGAPARDAQDVRVRAGAPLFFDGS
jgi:hypothetical protein